MVTLPNRPLLAALLITAVSVPSRAQTTEPRSTPEETFDDSVAEDVDGPEEAAASATGEPAESRPGSRVDVYGWFEAEGRFFLHPAVNPQGQPLQNDYWFNGSMAWEPGLLVDVTDYMDFELTLFGRVDQHDRSRTHGDMREVYFDLSFDAWTLGFGVHQVHWGVTQSNNQVDIINQVDFVEDFVETNIKLGQAMVTSSYTHEKAGAFALYVMSWARPLVFPSTQGRPSLVVPVDNSTRVYESRLKQGQIDVAARWSGSQQGFDWGLSYFFGTARQPQLFAQEVATPDEHLQPVYELIHQGGLESRFIHGGWQLQVDAVVRGGQGPTFGAVTGGFGYTFYDARGSIVDFGIVTEYNYDGRENNTFIVFQNDLFVGFQIDVDEPGQTQILIGFYVDVEDASFYILGDASRRFDEHWEIWLGTRAYIPQRLNVLEAFAYDSRIDLGVRLHY
jgi:hypothetical protein